MGVLFSLNIRENDNNSNDKGASFTIILGKVGRFCVNTSFAIILYFSVNIIF
jgi:hypothetical protein